jgi:hypothetical protein
VGHTVLWFHSKPTRAAVLSSSTSGRVTNQTNNPVKPVNRLTFTLSCLALFALSGINAASAQTLPTTHPKMISIVREEIKVGRAAEHAKHETGWPAAYEKAKSTDYYLAMTSLTGASEVWYVAPWESHAAQAASMKREDKDPVLSAELARLALADAEYVSSVRNIQALGRPDLSAGSFPDLGKARFFQITTYRVRPGHEAQFEEAAKAYGAARLRVAPKHGFRVYQVIAGMPAPTFFVFSSVEDYAQFDETTAAHQATLKAQTPEEQDKRQKFQSEGVASAETNRYKLDPAQSYVSKETRASDPEFWSTK